MNESHHNDREREGGDRDIEKVYTFTNICVCVCVCPSLLTCVSIWTRAGESPKKFLKYWHTENVCNSFYGFCTFCQSHARTNIASQVSHIARITGPRREHVKRDKDRVGDREEGTLYLLEY